MIAVPEAVLTFPAPNKSNTASCKTSEYTSEFLNSESKKPFNTALAKYTNRLVLRSQEISNHP